MSRVPDAAGPSGCPVCARPLEARPPSLPTFVAGGSVNVFECPNCHLLTTWPLTIPDGLYEAIYENASDIDGYARYTRYARRVAIEPAPLHYLAEQEDVYWAVEQFVNHAVAGSLENIVDVGSGLGYVTAALRKSGVNCLGVDISEHAVARARKSYGPWFHVQDVFDPEPKHVGAFDAALVLETIEHVPDPAAYLLAVKRWLRPNGRILVTTPNRDVQPEGSRWRTDLPPVHLHWFSERAVDELAQRIHMAASHTDFTKFNRSHLQTVDLSHLDEVLGPSLTSDMQVMGSIRPSTRIKERVQDIPVVAKTFRFLYDRLRPRRTRLTSERSFTLAAVLSSPEGATRPDEGYR